MLKVEVKKGNLDRAIKAMRWKIRSTIYDKFMEKAIAREQWKRENDD